jgi:hypothetical protein
VLKGVCIIYLGGMPPLSLSTGLLAKDRSWIDPGSIQQGSSPSLPGGLRFVAGRSRILDLTNETCDGVQILDQILDQILEVRLEDFAHRPSTTSRA